MFEGGKFNNKREAIIGVSLVVGFVALIVLVLWWLIDLIKSIDKTVLAAIVAALVAVFSLIFTYWKEKQKSIREAHREKKIEIYSTFFDIMFELMENAKSAKNDNEDHVKLAAARWTSLNRGVLFYGSPSVLKAFSDFRLDSSTNPSPGSIMRATGRIILAMREDIGLSNKGLDELTVHQIYITDDVRKMELLQ